MEHARIRNESIALAMIEAGCTLAPKDEAGPLINIYTPDLLRSRGYLPREQVTPETFELSVIKCRERKIRGSVTYLFVRDAKFSAFRKAWNEMAAEKVKAKREDRPMSGVPQPRDVAMMARESYMRIEHERKITRELVWCVDSTCMIGREKYEPDPEFVREIGELPDAKVRTEGMEAIKAQRIGTTTITGKQWTLGLTNEQREALGIHPRPGPPEFYRSHFNT